MLALNDPSEWLNGHGRLWMPLTLGIHVILGIQDSEPRVKHIILSS